MGWFRYIQMSQLFQLDPLWYLKQDSYLRKVPFNGFVCKFTVRILAVTFVETWNYITRDGDVFIMKHHVLILVIIFCKSLTQSQLIKPRKLRAHFVSR